MEIATDRLVLREFRADDWRAVHTYQNHPLYLRYYPWSSRSEDDVRAFVERLTSLQHDDPRTKFQLVITVDGDLIGNCGIRMDAPDATEADIGYELDPAHWAKGYATEGMRALMDFGFTTLRVHRVWSWTTADNTASQRVMERLGMKLEGRQREKEFFKDRWRDNVLYAILEDEWREGQ